MPSFLLEWKSVAYFQKNILNLQCVAVFINSWDKPNTDTRIKSKSHHIFHHQLLKGWWWRQIKKDCF